MRTRLISLLVGITIAGGTARAQTPSGQDGGAPGSGPVFTLSVSSLPQTTAAPILEIDAVVQDNGAVFARGPGVVFVTVRGPSDAGGGALPLPDGGIDQSVDGPLIVPLSPGNSFTDAGVFTTFFDGGTPLFLGNNTVTVSALDPSGARRDSTPQVVRLDVGLDGGSGGGTDGGVPTDGGSGGGSDGGVPTDGGSGGGTDGGFSPDGGPLFGASPALITTTSSGESGGCSTTDGGPPSFLLMALAVVLLGLGRRAVGG